MKIKYKKTGEIFDIKLFEINNKYLMDREVSGIYGKPITLETLTENFEDYDESEEYYYISDIGSILKTTFDKNYKPDVFRKSIGNYFATEEDAEKAIKKLKNKVYKSKKYPSLNWDCATQSFVDYER